MRPSRILIHCIGQTKQALEKIFVGNSPTVVWSALPLDAIVRAQNRDETFQILIIDARSPIAIHCCDTLKAASPKSQVVFLAHHDDLQLRLQVASYNCAAFLKMPEQIDDVMPLINCLLNQ